MPLIKGYKMSYYRVKLDGVDIYNPAYREMTLINPVCTTSLGETGNFEFTFPKGHVFADAIVPYGSTIEVLEDGESIFYGRPLPPSIDMYGQKKVHCEGALGFLNDIIVPPLSEYVDADTYVPGQGELHSQVPSGSTGKIHRVVLLQDYLSYVFSKHNQIETRADRKIYLRGEILETKAIQYRSNYKSCLEILRSEIMPYTKASLVVSRESGSTYATVFTTASAGNQPIESGLNLLDLAAQQKSFYTAVVAKGGKPQGATDHISIDTPITLGADIVAKYGMLCAFQQFDYDNLSQLEWRCRQFLTEQQFEDMEFTIKALDLHIISGAYNALKIGRTVAFRSPAHGINRVNVVINKIVTHLDTGEKEISLGGKKETKPLTWMLTESGSTSSTGSSSAVNLDVDYAPTEGSTNPVTSGGVYDAIQNAGGGGSGGDGWIHQIDGVTHETGTVNFVTTGT